MWRLFAQAYPDELPPPAPWQLKKWEKNFEELQQMQNELKIWEMIIDFLGSGDFLLIILTFFVGIALVKSVGVVDRYINRPRDDNDKS